MNAKGAEATTAAEPVRLFDLGESNALAAVHGSGRVHSRSSASLREIRFRIRVPRGYPGAAAALASACIFSTMLPYSVTSSSASAALSES